MVGLFAEKRPTGFAFSDTAFRIFILMASPAAQQRPVLHQGLPAGDLLAGRAWHWIRDNDMRTVLLRHFPELRPALRGVDNAFAPWKRVTGPQMAAVREPCAGSALVPRAVPGPTARIGGRAQWWRADDDEDVLGLQRADQRVVEAQRAAAAGDRQDDVAQRARVEARPRWRSPCAGAGRGPGRR